jgi:hypothetical protein
MTQEQITAICNDIGTEGSELENIAMERTKVYLQQVFSAGKVIDPGYITTIAGSYFDGVLDTLRNEVNE